MLHLVYFRQVKYQFHTNIKKASLHQCIFSISNEVSYLTRIAHMLFCKQVNSGLPFCNDKYIFIVSLAFSLKNKTYYIVYLRFTANNLQVIVTKTENAVFRWTTVLDSFSRSIAFTFSCGQKLRLKN